MKRIVLAGVILACAASAPASHAQGAAEALVDIEAQAQVELAEAQAALQAADPQAAHPTQELRDLIVALPHLEGAERREARSLLARPPEDGGGGYNDAGAFEPFGAEWSEAATNSRESYVSPGGSFVVHWVTSSSDAPSDTDTAPDNGVPDYVEQVAARADTSEAVQNGELGWPEPKSDGQTGGGNGRTDVYLADICEPGLCVFGYAGPDDSSQECNEPPFECASFLVLDNDYSPAEFGYTDPDVPLSVTMAHEYSHVLQFSIDTVQDLWMFESTAVWAEEHVFPDADDWLFYMTSWARRPSQPITDRNAGGGLRIYGSAVWNHWLDLGAAYGPDVVLDSWQRSHDSDPRHFAAGAYNLGIRDNGGAGFAHEFARFAAATAEWRVNDDNFADEERLPDVARQGGLRPGSRAEKFKLDHTAFRLLRIKPGDTNRIRLRVRAERGVRSGVALVGRDGTRLGGSISQRLEYRPRGRRLSVSLGDVQRFERITAVIANADARVRGFRGGDWRYTRDDRAYRVSLGAN